MHPDAPPPSPFAAPPPGSPVRPEPEQPRLGIIHLLGWTACAAVYFSITRATATDELLEGDPVGIVFWAASGIVSGAALGGLLLFAARRYRGLTFPGQPGETLWLLLGVGAVVSLGDHSLRSLPLANEGAGIPSPWYEVIPFLANVLMGVLYFVAAIGTKVRRWRWYFATVVVAVVNSFFVRSARGFVYLSPQWQFAFEQSAFLLPLLVILPVIVRDLSRCPPCRWTHWAGIGIQLCGGAVWGTSVLRWLLFPPEPY